MTLRADLRQLHRIFTEQAVPSLHALIWGRLVTAQDQSASRNLEGTRIRADKSTKVNEECVCPGEKHV